jgi:tRNA threonylcarbamoyladenosine biosynthesis protein TsaB
MAVLLCIETATDVCSVALFRDGALIGIRESSERNVHSAMLTSFIEEVVKSAGIAFAGLDAIAVSMGPGSYTGLRIGVASAKGLCYALGKPLIAVPTLQAMAAGMTPPLHPSPVGGGAGGGVVLICPMIDARRMEVYSAVYDQNGIEIRETRAEIVDEYSFRDYLADGKIIFGGDGAAKCKPLFEHHLNAVFMDDFRVSASHMINLAAERFNRKEFENLAYFEPFYLKDFVAGKPRVKGLH